jgi:anti-anti-sigma factor
MHTLILIGELDRASAHTLEAEIEQACERGASGVTLDLRGLTRIDMTGVAVIAFRSGLCARRGHEFALIPGPSLIQRAFELAGVSERLPFVRGAEHPIEPAVAAGEMPELPPAELAPGRAVATVRRRPASPLVLIRSFALLRMWQSHKGSVSS